MCREIHFGKDETEMIVTWVDSKNYDAKLKMNCTGGNEYLTVVNSFNITDNLLATERFSPFLYVKLPTVSVAQEGYPIQFANVETDISYLTQLLDLLAEQKLLGSVTYVDASERFSLSFVLSNSTRVEIGALKDMNLKLTLLVEELRKNPLDHNIYAVIDVSNTSKPIYRQIAPENLFD